MRTFFADLRASRVSRVLLLSATFFLGLSRLVEPVQAKSVNVTIDDASGQVHFSDSAVETSENWNHTSEAVRCYNNTESFTSAVGAAASFQFDGTGVYVLGSDSRFSRPFFVTLDGSQTGPFVGNNSANNLNLVPIWNVTNLTQETPHLIVITTAAVDNPVDGLSYNFVLDGFIVTQEVAASTTSALGTSSASTSASNTPSPTAVSSHSTNVGAIVGGVVGGAVGTALLVLVIFLCNRRRSRRREKRALDMMAESDKPGRIVPFTSVEHEFDPYVDDETRQQQAVMGLNSEMDMSKGRKKGVSVLPNDTFTPNASGSRAGSEARGPASGSASPLLGVAAQPQDPAVLQEVNVLRAEIARMHMINAAVESQNGDDFLNAIPPPDYETPSAMQFAHDDAIRSGAS